MRIIIIQDVITILQNKIATAPVKQVSRQYIGRVVLLLMALASTINVRADDLQQIEHLTEQVQQLEEQIQELTLHTKQNTKGLEAAGDAMERGFGGDTKRKTSTTTIGGYGELHYNRINVDASQNRRQIDFHRFVLFVGHHFNDRLRLFSEVELEHSLAGDGKPGEVELEQAYLEYDLNQHHRLRAGLFLVPVGLLNETHEPPTFYGVERNEVEKIIIPTTWWAGGMGYNFTTKSGWTVDLSLHEGLKIPALGTEDDNTDVVIRSGRQKTAKANAENFAFTSRLRYAAIAGLELAASFQYQSDVTQAGGDGIGSATMLSLHAAYHSGRFGMRALYALWNLNVNSNSKGQAIAAQGNNKQYGFYFEPSYKFNNDNVGIFARYEEVKGGRPQDRFNQWSLGANFWLYEKVVMKFDYVMRNHNQSSQKGRNLKGINLGIGYYF